MEYAPGDCDFMSLFVLLLVYLNVLLYSDVLS